MHRGQRVEALGERQGFGAQKALSRLHRARGQRLRFVHALQIAQEHRQIVGRFSVFR